VGFPINTETNDACVAISPDGQRMIVYRTTANGLSGDLYLSTLTAGNRWSQPTLMPQEINSPYLEASACFSNDTVDIYFSSDRPGGYGGKDLYRLRRLPNGKWSQPYNLGRKINTRYDEDAPFLHPDGVTLYFSSKGFNSMGEYDVFRSTLNENRTDFMEAENLGYPINGPGNDIFFVVSADGQRGYYSSSKKDSYGDVDIYEIETRFGNNDLKVRTGVASLGGKPSRVLITLMDRESGQMQGTYYSHPDHGRFILVLNPLKRYQAIVEADGYVTEERMIEPLTFQDSNEPIRFNLKKQDAQ
jgi:Tol biopolymer transport system component